MRPTDSGRTTAKTVTTVVILSAVVFLSVKLIPVYVRAYELKDHLHEVVVQAMAGQHPSVESVRNNILAKAHDLDLPVRAEDVKIEYTTGRIQIQLDYKVPVDLTVLTWPLHFTPSADNRSLT